MIETIPCACVRVCAKKKRDLEDLHAMAAVDGAHAFGSGICFYDDVNGIAADRVIAAVPTLCEVEKARARLHWMARQPPSPRHLIFHTRKLTHSKARSHS